MTKKCSKCQQIKPLTEFHKNRTTKDQRRRECKACHCADVKRSDSTPQERERRKQYFKAWKASNPAKIAALSRACTLKRKYGITPSQYNAMLAAQGGVCAICRDRPAKRLCVDHCHVSGKVRGLLCAKHNKALGLFGDNVTLLRLAAEYVEANNE